MWARSDWSWSEEDEKKHEQKKYHSLPFIAHKYVPPEKEDEYFTLKTFEKDLKKRGGRLKSTKEAARIIEETDISDKGGDRYYKKDENPYSKTFIPSFSFNLFSNKKSVKKANKKSVKKANKKSVKKAKKSLKKSKSKRKSRRVQKK